MSAARRYVLARSFFHEAPHLDDIAVPGSSQYLGIFSGRFADGNWRHPPFNGSVGDDSRHLLSKRRNR
jgi:hypothetical protein